MKQEIKTLGSIALASLGAMTALGSWQILVAMSFTRELILTLEKTGLGLLTVGGLFLCCFCFSYANNHKIKSIKKEKPQ